MNQYLTPEQRAQFERQLANGGLSEQDRQAAFEQGVDMARADMASPGADGDALRRSGFDSVQELLDAYEASQAGLSEAEEALRRLSALAQALDNGKLLEPADPETYNRRVQKAWTRHAGAMRDLDRLLPEMAEYIMAHPGFALQEDGLERAYDAVRAGKYRSEEELLDDPESVKRLSADPRVRNAVLTAHLSEVYRAGRELPAFIAGGGSIPAPGGGTDSMEQAKSRLEALLKRN